MPALVQHFEGVTVPRQRSSSAAAAAPADSAPHSSTPASETSLAARASRVIAAVSDPAAAGVSTELHRRWTQSREDAPSISRAATRDSVYGPAASTAAPYRRRTEERASRSERATPEPAPAGSEERASVPDTSAMVTVRDAVGPALRMPPDTATGLTRRSETGSGQPDMAREISAPGRISDTARSGDARAGAAGAPGDPGPAQARSLRAVRFSSGSAEPADRGADPDRHALGDGLDPVSAETPGDRTAAETGEQPVQAASGDWSDAQVRRPLPCLRSSTLRCAPCAQSHGAGVDERMTSSRLYTRSTSPLRSTWLRSTAYRLHGQHRMCPGRESGPVSSGVAPACRLPALYATMMIIVGQTACVP